MSKSTATPRRKKAAAKNEQPKSGPKLQRTTFSTSRELDFFSEKELMAQTGHPIGEWSFVFLKEAIDNGLDACEEADIAPQITVTADACGITVSDNGPGIAESTIEGALDFRVRTSNREQYVAPDRGAQGNALKTLLGMPNVIDPDHGRLIVVANGIRHEIISRADPVTQKVIIKDDKTKANGAKGTSIRLQWSTRTNDEGNVAWPFGDECCPLKERDENDWHDEPSVKEVFDSLINGFALFNPHLTLTIDWFGKVTKIKATDPKWSKWKPNRPTSAHWYELHHLERLIAAYIAHDWERSEDRTVAAFVAEFDGLSGSQKRKKVLDETGLARVNLSELATDDGLKHDIIARLLESMKRHSKIVKAPRLGIIGREHLAVRLEALGCDPERFEYRKVARVDDGMPFVLESAFGWLGDKAEDRRLIFSGANWSAALGNPFRSFGQSGVGLEDLLTEQRASAYEPIVFVLHFAHPRVEFVDRGKTAIVIEGGKGVDDES